MKPVLAILLPALCSAAAALAQTPALSLDDCLKIAAEQQPALAAAHAGVSAASEAVGEARAPYFPQVDLNAGYHRWQKRAFLPSGLSLPGKAIPELIGPLNDWNGGLSTKITLYDFGERRAGLDASKARRTAAEASASATQAEVRLSVQTAFFALASSQDLLAVAEKNLDRTKRHLQMTEIRRAAGAVPQADVLRFQAEEACAQLQVISAQGNVRIAAGRLNTAMGRNAELPLSITPPALPSPPATEDLAAAIQRALTRRPELLSAEKQVSAAHSEIAAARATRAPKLRADGSYGWNDTAWTPETREWQAGVTVDLPVFDGGSRRSRIARTRAEFAREEASLENLRLQVRQEVWTAASEIERTWAAIAANEIAVKANEESLRVVQERYQNGAAVVTDLLDTQTSLARAEAGLASARGDYLSARAAYDRATAL